MIWISKVLFIKIWDVITHPCHKSSCTVTKKTSTVHQTFVRQDLYILFKIVKSLIKHLGLVFGNVWHVQWFSWTLQLKDKLCDKPLPEPVLTFCSLHQPHIWLNSNFELITYWDSSFQNFGILLFLDNSSYTLCFNEVESGYTGFTLSIVSVRLSVCPSVDRMVSALYPFHIYTILSSNCRRCCV